jgi:hypothetical protein
MEEKDDDYYKIRGEVLYNTAKIAKEVAISEQNMNLVNKLWPITLLLNQKEKRTKENVEKTEEILRNLGLIGKPTTNENSRTIKRVASILS